MRNFTFSLLLLSGCSASTLSQSWQLDRLRILGVAAEPAEPRPGEVTTFRSLVYLPAAQDLEGVVWFACLPQNATDFGCTVDANLDPSTASYEDLVAAGFIGFSPVFPPVWTPPADALEGLDEAARAEGVSALVNLTALPAGADASLSDADLELAYKRVPISEAATPNHNPTILDITVDGEVLEAGQPIVVEAGGEVEIEPLLTADSVETYTYTTSDGLTEERTEEPYFSWYTEAGTFDQSFSLHPYSATTWTAPEEAFTGLMLVVMRDRRGGMDWREIPLQVDAR